jgi:hypothetical protein
MSELEHVVHACVVVVVSFLLMVYLLKQGKSLAATRSVALGSLVLSYMLVFGHTLPKLLR